MKKYIINIFTLILLFAYVGDGIDLDELLFKTPLLHEDYIGQSTVENIIVSSSGDTCSSGYPAKRAFSNNRSKVYRGRIQWVDQDSPSLSTVSFITQQIIDLSSRKSSFPLPPANFNRSFDIYFLSRINV